MTEDSTIAPWYRQPWLWFLILFPSLSVGYCIVAITLALTSQNSMVTDDYSKDGLGINQSLARDKVASDLGLQAGLATEGRTLSVELTGRDGATGHDYLTLQLYHPTLAQRDRVIQLQSEGGGHYRGAVAGNLDGRWYLDLRGPDNEWRLKGEATLPARDTIALTADPRVSD